MHLNRNCRMSLTWLIGVAADARLVGVDALDARGASRGEPGGRGPTSHLDDEALS
jgi:hypothetical protein